MRETGQTKASLGRGSFGEDACVLKLMGSALRCEVDVAAYVDEARAKMYDDVAQKKDV